MTSTLTVYVPTYFEGTVFEEIATINGNTVPCRYQPRDHNGHSVVDIPLGLFQRMLAGNHGKLWADGNPEALQWLGEADRRTMTCNAFPGADRAPPLAPLAPAAPVMVRMAAPDHISGVSVEGAELQIPADRIVTVTETVASTLCDFGFTPA
jgi:hypothetical protein